MRKLTFKAQIRVSLVILIFCLILSNLTKQGIFDNIGWITYGLFFIINPVWPDSWDWQDHSKLRLGCRIAGVLAIMVGLLTRFVV